MSISLCALVGSSNDCLLRSVRRADYTRSWYHWSEHNQDNRPTDPVRHRRRLRRRGIAGPSHAVPLEGERL